MSLHEERHAANVQDSILTLAATLLIVAIVGAGVWMVTR